MTKRKAKSQGMNWIRKEKRLAIYLRDGLACAYCEEGIEDGARLTLDHLIPYSQGGSNREDNLITACHRCNSARGNRDYYSFIQAAAGYLDHDICADDIVAHIGQIIHRPLDIAAAKEMIARRGGFTKARKSL